MSTEAWGRIDGCPECVHNTEAPRSIVSTDTGYRAGYVCTDCGHAWTSDWKA